jgi:uncharacterized membrane protein YfcA
VHGWSGTVQWGIVGRLAAGSVPATLLTLWFLSRWGAHADSPHGFVTMVLGWTLLLTAIGILFRRTIVNYLVTGRKPLEARQTTAFTIALGVVLGVLVSLTSVGAGAIGMTVLLVLYPKRDVAQLVGSDIAHAVPLTLLAGLGHWMMGSVNWQLLFSLLTGSIPGIIFGSLIAARVPDGVLRPILASTLVLVGRKLLT